MSRESFINSLRANLMGNVSEREVEESIEYYSDYISSKMRMGQTEDQVIKELGSPRLIAKSIIGARGVQAEEGTYREANSYRTGEEEEEASGRGHRFGFGMGGMNRPRRRWPAWLTTLVVFFVIFLVITLVTKALFALLPILLPVICVIYVIRILRDRV